MFHSSSLGVLMLDFVLLLLGSEFYRVEKLSLRGGTGEVTPGVAQSLHLLDGEILCRHPAGFLNPARCVRVLISDSSNL